MQRSLVVFDARIRIQRQLTVRRQEQKMIDTTSGVNLDEALSDPQPETPPQFAERPSDSRKNGLGADDQTRKSGIDDHRRRVV